MYLKTPSPQQLAPTLKMIKLLENLLCTPYLHGTSKSPLIIMYKVDLQGVVDSKSQLTLASGSYSLFLQSTPLIRKLHFRGECFC